MPSLDEVECSTSLPAICCIVVVAFVVPLAKDDGVIGILRRQLLGKPLSMGLVVAIRLGSRVAKVKIVDAKIEGLTSVPNEVQFTISDECEISLSTIDCNDSGNSGFSRYWSAKFFELESAIQIGNSDNGGILLRGASGSGKSTLMRMAATRFSESLWVACCNILPPDSDHIFSSVLSKLEVARQNPEIKILLLFDDIDIPMRIWDPSLMHALLQGITLLTKSCTNVRLLFSMPNTPRVASFFSKSGVIGHSIDLYPPSHNERMALLSIILLDSPFSSKEIHFQIAKGTGGCQIGDIVRICRDFSIRLEAVPNAQLSKIVAESLSEIEAVELSGVGRSLSSKVALNWDSVSGYHSIKSRLEQLVLWPLERPEMYKRLGVEPSCGVLLHGLSGCGKTHIAMALASIASANFITVNGPELFQRYLGESEEAVRRVFAAARSTAPCILFFDEIDAIASARGQGGEDGSGVYERVLSVLLNEMDGISTRKGDVVVLGCTNRVDMLDSAIIRPGRFVLLEIPDPTVEDVRELLHSFLDKTPSETSIDLSLLAQEMMLLGGTMADHLAVCRNAALEAMRVGVEEVDRTHFGKAIRTKTTKSL